MKGKKGILVVSTLALMAAAPVFAGSWTTYIDNESVNSPYSFDFQTLGAPNAQPVQVFTDEYETFIEMPGDVTPHYAIVGGSRVQLKESPPYVVLDSSPREFFLRTSKGEVEVVRRGDSRLAAEISGRTAQSGCDPVCESPAYVLRAGTMLSESLRRYVKAQGWNSLRWNVDHDYFIEDDIPMRGDMQSAIMGLVRAYQDQGGLMGVSPRFAEANRVVVFESSDMSGEPQSLRRR
ncbi:TcpQ domain-containing protein [Thioalkalivibrio sp. ALE16]|uniref:TcpQ domain-containing protein n=1 Tax=Thioalkalivibrio sp. ALE16 TaxID=1158172 RepID=UPI00037831FD|nr:TcpQ domain-containing protein [Thioalkalivibrio sp. ALE16]